MPPASNDTSKTLAPPEAIVDELPEEVAAVGMVTNEEDEPVGADDCW